jgi:hypothetical protein
MSSEEASRNEALMLQAVEHSLQAADGVSTAFLSRLHPELAQHYRDQFMKGQLLYAEGIRGDDLVKQVQGNALMMKWSTFWVANQDHILGNL